MMGIKKQAGDGQRPPGMEEDCIASQGPKRTVELNKNKKKFPH
jgi:hypothetical protein